MPGSTAKSVSPAACALCLEPGGEVLRDDGFARIVLAGDADHPGFCRVILNAHVREMTDLPEADRARLMGLVFVVEGLLRELLSPDKINLAEFGNVVPHLHWHVIPRFTDDAHFPNAVWGEKKREGARPLPAGFNRSLRQRLDEMLGSVR
ncbi:MAG TPA: HIT family protein [Burkholderiales bacterium]|nr:HIT family protein [Burkholderiales bacterium]